MFLSIVEQLRLSSSAHTALCLLNALPCCCRCHSFTCVAAAAVWTFRLLLVGGIFQCSVLVLQGETLLHKAAAAVGLASDKAHETKEAAKDKASQG